MNSKIIQKPDYADYNLDLEKNKLSDFLKLNQLLISPDFVNQIDIGDIIEVYSFPENMQIYSNSEFKKLCSYTEAQMREIPFPQLFWRDQDVHLSLMKRASDICQLGEKNYKWDLTNHELVESLHPKKRTFEMNMKNITPCFTSVDASVKAWASTLQVDFIFEWENPIN